MKLLTAEWITPPFDESVSFYVRGMNGLEYYDFLHAGNVKATGNKLTVSGEQASIVLQACMDWRGVEDDKGPAKFSQDKWSLVGLRYMDFVIGEIIKRSSVDEDSEKN